MAGWPRDRDPSSGGVPGPPGHPSWPSAERCPQVCWLPGGGLGLWVVTLRSADAATPGTACPGRRRGQESGRHRPEPTFAGPEASGMKKGRRRGEGRRGDSGAQCSTHVAGPVGGPCGGEPGGQNLQGQSTEPRAAAQRGQRSWWTTERPGWTEGTCDGTGVELATPAHLLFGSSQGPHPGAAGPPTWASAGAARPSPPRLPAGASRPLDGFLVSAAVFTNLPQPR